jgi:hypothetical protein
MEDTMTKTELSHEDTNAWYEAMDRLYEHVAVASPDIPRLTGQGVSRLWSVSGYREAPDEIIELMIRAIETGYAAALRDVHAGTLDSEISDWRPDLNED